MSFLWLHLPACTRDRMYLCTPPGSRLVSSCRLFPENSTAAHSDKGKALLLRARWNLKPVKQHKMLESKTKCHYDFIHYLKPCDILEKSKLRKFICIRYWIWGNSQAQNDTEERQCLCGKKCISSTCCAITPTMPPTAFPVSQGVLPITKDRRTGDSALW